MPRSFRFDHFLVPKSPPRERATPSPELKAAVAHKGLPEEVPEGELHYGQEYAETVQRYRARAQTRQQQSPTETTARSASAAKRTPTR